jgi:hypothetical protein
MSKIIFYALFIGAVSSTAMAATNPSEDLVQALVSAGFPAPMATPAGLTLGAAKIGCVMSSFMTQGTVINCDVSDSKATVSANGAAALSIYQDLELLGAKGAVQNPEYVLLTVIDLKCHKDARPNVNNPAWACNFAASMLNHTGDCNDDEKLGNCYTRGTGSAMECICQYSALPRSSDARPSVCTDEEIRDGCSEMNTPGGPACFCLN